MGPIALRANGRPSGSQPSLPPSRPGWPTGARHAARKRRALAALGITGSQQFLFGIVLLMSILLYRNYFYASAGSSAALKHFLVLLAVTGLGAAAAAIATPVATRRISKAGWIIVLVVASGLATGALGSEFLQGGFIVLGFVLGMAGQGLNICTTTIYQEEIADEYLGRVFSLNDMSYNASFVLGATVCAFTIPATGRSLVLVLAAARRPATWLSAAGYRLLSGPSPEPIPAPARPAQQFLNGAFTAERAVLHPQLEQVRVGLADQRARRDPQQLHDLVAVQVGPDRGQLLLLGELDDPAFERVVARGQALRLGPVPGRGVRPGQRVQPGQQRAGVSDVAPDGRVGPLAAAVPVEPQVQADQLGHVGGHVAGEPQLAQPLPGQLGADGVVVVERDPAAGQQRPGLRLADVVQQRGQPQPQVTLQAVSPLQRDGLVEHGERVPVDVLVPVVLVHLEPQPRHLGQHVVSDAGLDQQVDAGRRAARPGRQQQLGELGGNPLGRHDLEPVGQFGHRRDDLGGRGAARARPRTWRRA